MVGLPSLQRFSDCRIRWLGHIYPYLWKLQGSHLAHTRPSMSATKAGEFRDGFRVGQLFLLAFFFAAVFFTVAFFAAARGPDFFVP
jgi:hypothetical protein